jgi:hypothetical protein
MAYTPAGLDALGAEIKADEAEVKAEEAEFRLWMEKVQAEYVKRRRALEARKKALADERHRLRLLPLVGVKGGVRIWSRAPAGGRAAAALDDRRGTLLAVRGTQCVVHFGEVGGDARPREVPLEDLVPAWDGPGLPAGA